MDNKKGLNSKEVDIRIKEGKVNISNNNKTKSIKEIVLSNTITFFNIVNVILFILVILVGSYQNTIFIYLIIVNTLTSIYQEIKTKKVLDKLSILTTSKARVIRDGSEVDISIDQIVLDDIIVLKSGFQVPSDSKVISGNLEVNESLLTGEVDPIEKTIDDEVLSGSFITSGYAICKVIRVGDANYSSTITSEAKKHKKANSVLNNEINEILKVISYMIIPLCLLLFYKSYYITGISFKESILKTVSAALGMIPEGIVLLTTVALASSVYKLSKHKTLVRELFYIESLARVDVLCLDKTGTITEGKIVVESSRNLVDTDVDNILGNMLRCFKEDNITSIALKNKYKLENTLKESFILPYSSDRKYSAVSFVDQGTYFIGARQFIFKDGNKELESICNEYAEKGYRILVLAHTTIEIKENIIPIDLIPVAIILMTDIVRSDAKDTLDFFNKQGVDIKIISGDDPITVSAIAAKAGVLNAENYVDATTLKTEADILGAVKTKSVFGRVTPIQKKQLVIALKSLGHTVAMTGDGVNDVLAFKEADCSIAMLSGSDALKNAANLVLLDDNFSAMPKIVAEGRKVVNNITISASMYIIKTIFSVLIALITVLIGQVYPFEPIHLSIINGCCVAIPTFFLTYENNYSKIKGSFLKTVITNAFPAAFTITILATLVMNIGHSLGSEILMLSTMCVLLTGWNYMAALERLYSPMNTYRKIVIYGSEALYFIAMIIGKDIIGLTTVSYIGIITLIAIGHYSNIFNRLSEQLFNTVTKYFVKVKGTK